ncbi:hypothetical protein Rhopal_007615-T1 [Rhodotorula paludigena]|uniref:Mitochondrial import receptor subunit tom22 n=1 Tax=Rhodotorula paludigena TaxID=86838 RepID=A0AAV5GYC3_9BASI|nr:hypothetical protein Rhopal_007615-T1 [Rhodotorula paludigena]
MAARVALAPVASSHNHVINDDAWSSASSDAGSDVDSVVSDDGDLQLAPFDPSQETLADRFYALRDMIPPTARAQIADAASATSSWIRWTAGKAGNAAWIVTTSALLVGMPLLLSIEGEAALVAQEKEFLNQPGAPNPYGAPAQPGAPGQATPQGLVPAGF